MRGSCEGRCGFKKYECERRLGRVCVMECAYKGVEYLLVCVCVCVCEEEEGWVGL